jgi:AraC-like DNA-binding protein
MVRSVDASHPVPPQFIGHSVPGSQVLQLVELLEFWRVEPSTLLAGSGLDPDMLAEPEARVPIETMNLLVRRARSLTGEPALGIFLGLRRRVSMYGFLGFAMMSASTLGEALELAVRFSSMVSTAIVLRLQVEGGVAALRFEEHCDPGDVRDVAVLALIVGLDQIGKALTGCDMPGEAHLAIPRPAYADRFPELLASARFDQPVTQLVFDAKHLEQPLVAPDRAGLRLARRQCERALCDLGLDGALLDRVRSLISSPEGVRSLEVVADSLHVSARTLKRRLAAQGASFSELVEQERLQRAQLLLTSSPLSLAEITERLGYSTVPNFARAFRRWTGQTPAAYRREQRARRPRLVSLESAAQRPSR